MSNCIIFQDLKWNFLKYLWWNSFYTKEMEHIFSKYWIIILNKRSMRWISLETFGSWWMPIRWDMLSKPKLSTSSGAFHIITSSATSSNPPYQIVAMDYAFHHASQSKPMNMNPMWHAHVHQLKHIVSHLSVNYTANPILNHLQPPHLRLSSFPATQKWLLWLHPRQLPLLVCLKCSGTLSTSAVQQGHQLRRPPARPPSRLLHFSPRRRHRHPSPSLLLFLW